MFMGTSTALASSSAAWSSIQPSIAPHFSSSIPVFHHPTPTTVSSVEIVPFPTHRAVSDFSADVVIKLDADINIHHYRHYYDVPVASFHPKYYALEDGSLLSQRYVDDYRQSKAWVLLAGALFLFFTRNTLSAISYIRRSRVKDKTLYYLLLISQVLSLLSVVIQVLGDFDQSVNCTLAGAVKKVFMKFSCDTMITGILGIKAYRCLSNSRSVLMFLITTIAVMIVLIGFDMSRFEASRTLYGSCTENQDMRIMSAMIFAAFVETTVLCACFLYAIWRSYRTQTEARVTLRTSEDGSTGSADGEVKESVEGPHLRRGWWDYVPETPPVPPSNVEHISFTGLVRAFWDRFRQPWNRNDFASNITYQRKPSLPGIHPIPQPPRPSVPDASNRPGSDAPRIVRCPFRVIRGWIRYFSRLELFRKMLRNELLYTTFLTIVFLALAITMLVGVNKQILLGAEGWIVVNWIMITVCTMQSFERVVHRHELEAVLQHPAAWDRILHSEFDHGKVFFEKRSRRSKSPKSTEASALRSRHRDEPSEDPDPTIRTSSDGSSEMPVSPLMLTSTPRLGSRGSYKPSLSSSLPSFHVRPPSPPDFMSRPYTWDPAVAQSCPQPSPHDVDHPLDPLQPPTGPVASPPHYDTHTPSFDLRTHLRTSDQNLSDLDNHESES